MRANDPLYELAMTAGGHRKEDQFWIQTMTSLAERLERRFSRWRPER